MPKDSLSNKELIKQGYVGHIRDINYLEAEVLNYQLNRYPLLSHPTEFHGFIAEQDSLDKVRIYLGASNQQFNLGKVLITNGFTTVVLGSADFEKFNSH